MKFGYQPVCFLVPSANQKYRKDPFFHDYACASSLGTADFRSRLISRRKLNFFGATPTFVVFKYLVLDTPSVFTVDTTEPSSTTPPKIAALVHGLVALLHFLCRPTRPQ